MKNALIIIILLISIESNAQVGRFMKLFDDNQRRNFFSGVREFNGKFYSVGISALDTVKSFIVCTDLQGNEIWKKTLNIGDSTIFFSNFFDIDITQDSSLIITGSNAFRDTLLTKQYSRNPFILKMDTLGNVKWLKNDFHYYERDNSGVNLVSLPNNHYAFACISQNQANTQVKPTIIIVDGNGNLVRQKDYDEFSRKIVYANELLYLNDGNLLLLGYSRHVSSSNDYQGMLIKVDSSLNVIWKKEFGNNRFESFQGASEMIDGSIIISGIKSGNSLNISDYNSWLIRVNGTNGQLIKEKIFDFAFAETFRKCFVIEDGSIVITGELDNLDSLSSNAYIVKLNNNWDVIWRQSYSFEYVPGKPSPNENVFCFSKTSDKGFLIGGFSRDSKLSMPTQDAMLIKVDSNGCLEENCTYTSVINEENTIADILVYPNPAHQDIQISTSSEILSIRILDMYGRVIRTLTYSKGDIINISDLSSGFYMLQVFNKDGEYKAVKFSKN